MDDQPPRGSAAAVPQRERDQDADELGRAPPPQTPPPLTAPPQTAPPQETRSGLFTLLWLLLAILVVAGAVTWIVGGSVTSRPPAGRLQTSGPTPVGTATVTKGDMPIERQRARHRDAARDGHGADADQRAADRGRLPGRPDGQEGRFPRPDRPAALPGRARTGAGRSSPRTRPRSPTPSSTSRATRSWWRRTRSPRKRSTPRSPPSRRTGHGAVRPGAGRHAKAQPRLLPHHRAGRAAGSGCARSIPAITCTDEQPTASW